MTSMKVRPCLGPQAQSASEIIAGFVRQQWMMKVHLRNSGNTAKDDVLEAGLGCRRHRNGVAVTPEAAQPVSDKRRGRGLCVDDGGKLDRSEEPASVGF